MTKAPPAASLNADDDATPRQRQFCPCQNPLLFALELDVYTMCHQTAHSSSPRISHRKSACDAPALILIAESQSALQRKAGRQKTKAAELLDI